MIKWEPDQMKPKKHKPPSVLLYVLTAASLLRGCYQPPSHSMWAASRHLSGVCSWGHQHRRLWVQCWLPVCWPGNPYWDHLRRYFTARVSFSAGLWLCLFSRHTAYSLLQRVHWERSSHRMLLPTPVPCTWPAPPVAPNLSPPALVQLTPASVCASLALPGHHRLLRAEVSILYTHHFFPVLAGTICDCPV